MWSIGLEKQQSPPVLYPMAHSQFKCQNIPTVHGNRSKYRNFSFKWFQLLFPASLSFIAVYSWCVMIFSEWTWINLYKENVGFKYVQLLFPASLSFIAVYSWCFMIFSEWTWINLYKENVGDWRRKLFLHLLFCFFSLSLISSTTLYLCGCSLIRSTELDLVISWNFSHWHPDEFIHTLSFQTFLKVFPF